jgi:hypothetical protein
MALQIVGWSGELDFRITECTELILEKQILCTCVFKHINGLLSSFLMKSRPPNRLQKSGYYGIIAK